MPLYRQPEFARNSALVARADVFAFAAHEGERSRGATRSDHPRAVAALLAARDAQEEIVAAALLHDVLEDTSVTWHELQREFGTRIAEVVAHLSEDPSIEPYAERKASLRQQVADAGPEAATIFLADKLARLQALERTGSSIEPEKLAHYRATLELLSRVHPGAPFVDEARAALARVDIR